MRNLTLAACAAGAVLCLGVPSSNATPIAPIGKSLSVPGTVETVQYGYCRRWARECRYRWGWGWRFRRCMVIHGC